MLLTFIYSIVVIIVLGFLYKKMIDWEYPLKISRAQAVHTIYDTLAVNKLITAEDELTQAFGIIMVVVAIVLAFALQVYVFKRLKKNAGTLAALSVLH
ncbi:MAG: hypothetical protein K6G83_15695 [Lachnospiraceae bacterium]|nr:hypothetical protein [Lachnospiraceae bacterium]